MSVTKGVNFCRLLMSDYLNNTRILNGFRKLFHVALFSRKLRSYVK